MDTLLEIFKIIIMGEEKNNKKTNEATDDRSVFEVVILIY